MTEASQSTTAQHLLIPDTCPECGAWTCVRLSSEVRPQTAIIHCGREHDEVSECGWSQPITEFDPAADTHYFVTMVDDA